MSRFYPEYHQFTPFSFYNPYADNAYQSLAYETRYRRLAEEHERRALAALALAEEEERRQTQQSQPRFFPSEEAHSHPPPYYHSAPRGSYAYAAEQQAQHEHGRQIEEWLRRRRLREREEEDLRHRREVERQKEEGVIRQLLNGFGLGPASPTSPRQTVRLPGDPPNQDRQTPRRACCCHNHEREFEAQQTTSQQPRNTAAPQSQQVAASSSDLTSMLWSALNSGRSDEEKAHIVSALGLKPPTRTPLSSTSASPVALGTAAPTAKSAAPTPHTAANTAPNTSPNTTLGSPPSTSKTASELLVSRPSPFAHIEAIQVKFDTTRSMFSATSDASIYKSDLNKLLAMLDEVESSGAEGLRGARKALVRAVESELEEMERRPKGKADVSLEDAPVDEAAASAEELTSLPAGGPVEESFEPKADVAAPRADGQQPSEPILTPDLTRDHDVPNSAQHADVRSPSASILTPVVVETTSSGATVCRPSTSSTAEGRGRSPVKSEKMLKKSPSSVEIEEVPDEGDMPLRGSTGF